jgi:hypothetical protein
MSILAAYSEPWSFEPRVEHMPEGVTLAELRARMDGLPECFDALGVITVNGMPVPREMWGRVKPKPLVRGVQTVVRFHAPVHGGGGGRDGGKNVFAVVAAIGLTLLSGAVGAGLLKGALGAKFAAGAVGANLAAGGISLVGSLLLNALVAPPAVDIGGNDDASRRNASAQGNLLEPNGPVPRVVGERRVFPPLVTEPLVTLDGDDEVVEAVYALAGPHRLQSIRIGAAVAADMAGVQVQTREGWPGEPPLTLVRRYGRTDAVQQELRAHVPSETSGASMASVDPVLGIPQPMTVATRQAPDEHQLQLIWPQGLFRPAADSDRLRVAFRVRIREVGEADWINLPEVHFRAAESRQMRAAIRLIWGRPLRGATDVSTGAGFVEFRSTAPGQTASPATAPWVADAYFYAGSGDTYLWQNNAGSSGLRNVVGTRYEARFHLDETVFPKGRYEVEIKRASAIRDATWSPAGYTVGGNLRDLFAYVGAGQIPYTREGTTDTTALLRSVSIWNSSPARKSDCALIAVKARNVQLDRVSVLAGGWVQDWNGTDWTDWAVTSNPAPNLRAIYSGPMNADPLPERLLDDVTLLEWRTRCIAEGYTADALFTGQSVGECARIVAACGYADPYMAEVWGVAQDYDRSDDAPVQVFTGRNSRGFSWRRAFPRMPDGFRVTFSDAAQDYEPRQIFVRRPGAARSSVIEQVSYEGITTEAAARARALYDLRQMELRGTFYSLEAPAEFAVCRKGSLVVVQHDSLASTSGQGRVVSGGTGRITLDTVVPLYNEPDVHALTDVHAVADMHLVGAVSAARVRRSDGSVETHELACETGESDELVFATEVDPVSEGDLVSVGALRRDHLRLVVLGVEPGPDYTARLTMVDEGARLFA